MLIWPLIERAHSGGNYLYKILKFIFKYKAPDDRENMIFFSGGGFRFWIQQRGLVGVPCKKLRDKTGGNFFGRRI